MTSPPLVAQRERRANAGSRMRALIENEFETEEMFAEEENDVEFVGQDEEDVFESDFASTEEEQEDDDARERELLREEKANRRAALQKTSRTTTTSLFPAKPAKPATKSQAQMPKTPQPRKRVSIALPPEDVTMNGTEGVPLRRRQSLRASTRMSKLALEDKLRESAARKASQTIKPRRAPPPRKTQDQLIADALELEERNVQSLQEFLAREEEKKRAARVFRKGPVEGGVLGFVSRTEVSTAPVQVLGDGIVQPATGEMHAVRPLSPAGTGAAEYSQMSEITQARNFVMLRDLDGVSGTKGHEKDKEKQRPAWGWADEMAALFGEHVDWGSLKVVPARNRPVHRRPPTCPLTGLPAPYLDPCTGVPYANLKAFRALRRVAQHQYVWSDARGLYWAAEDEVGARGVPGGWERAVSGRPEVVEEAVGIAGEAEMEGVIEERREVAVEGRMSEGAVG